MLKGRNLQIFSVLFILIILSGCKNPFKTRKSPPPKGQVGTWSTPSKPEIVLENLMHSYNEKIIENFNLCLSDTFVFSAPEDSIEAANINQDYLFADWNQNTEKRVTANIFNIFKQYPDSIDFSLYLNFETISKGEQTDSTEVLFIDYKLSIWRFKPKQDTIEATGTSTFHLKETGLNWWSIYFWEDRPKSSGGYNWADFKAEYRY